MTLILNLIAFSFLQFTSPPQEIDSTEDQQKVEQSVLDWADSTFTNHESYKFEHFKAFYTDEFFIQEMRLDVYREKISALKQKKEKGEYKGSDQAFAEEMASLEKILHDAEESIDPTVNKVTHYQTHFWSNIQTSDGITVYYELILKLDNNYTITEVIENSSIGKTDESHIAYRKNATIRVREK